MRLSSRLLLQQCHTPPRKVVDTTRRARARSQVAIVQSCARRSSLARSNAWLLCVFAHNTPVPAEVTARYTHLTTVQALAAAAADNLHAPAESGPRRERAQTSSQRLNVCLQLRVRRALSGQLETEAPPSASPSPPASKTSYVLATPRTSPPDSKPRAGCFVLGLSVVFNTLAIIVVALYATRLSFDSGANAVLVRMCCSGVVAKFAFDTSLNASSRCLKRRAKFQRSAGSGRGSMPTCGLDDYCCNDAL
eukprot:903595-Pleurochrysis_carterae.AAC.1